MGAARLPSAEPPDDQPSPTALRSEAAAEPLANATLKLATGSPARWPASRPSLPPPANTAAGEALAEPFPPAKAADLFFSFLQRLLAIRVYARKGGMTMDISFWIPIAIIFAIAFGFFDKKKKK
ncbi:hypothetical protein J31TS4_36840 [Paenibacillus sp. J31TS4]|nr:hypothetical protein J31TS4_36840 [Paenibacillus sp. J31TS4]